MLPSLGSLLKEARRKLLFPVRSIALSMCQGNLPLQNPDLNVKSPLSQLGQCWLPARLNAKLAQSLVFRGVH